MYREILLSTHAFVPIDELKAPIEVLKRKLTITSRYDPSLTLPLYKATDSHFGYPLYLKDVRSATDHLCDLRTPGTPISVTMAPDFRPRENQKAVLARFANEVRHGTTGWLLTMPTGAGKTVCACKMLEILGTTTLIIVPRESLLRQWEERIQEFTDIRADEIGRAQQDVCTYEGKKVVLGMIHSLAKDKYPEAFRTFFGLVLWDEVHVAAAKQFSQTLSLFAPRYRIGMSATPRRADGLEAIYRWSIGESLLSVRNQTLLSPIVQIQPYKAKLPRALFAIDATSARRAKLLSHLANDTTRNALIAHHIAAAAATGRRTLCFSERISQLQSLHDLLCTKEGIATTRIGIYTGETKIEDRQKIAHECTIILATYGVMAMGVDVPDLRAIVFGTPQANVTQAVGRILRVHEGAKDPLVIDILDTGSPDCQNWLVSREYYYTRIAKAQPTILATVEGPENAQKPRK